MLLGVALDAAAHADSDRSSWGGFWSGLIGRLDGAVDFVTLEDGFARAGADGPDAVLLANWLAPRSRDIGIIAGAPVNLLEPFHVSTAIATLDYVSEGRAGLLAQRLREARAAEGRRALGALNGFPADDRQAQDRDAQAAIEVISRLWDSWEDDAVIRDPKSQRFLDGSKLHYIDFEGADFRVLGPSITPRPPQGQPPVAIAWAEGDDPSLIREADIVFLPAGQGEIGDVIRDSRRGAEGAGPIFIADLDLGPEGPSIAGLVVAAKQATELGAGGIRIVLSDPSVQLGQLLSEVLPGLRDAGFVRRPSGGTLRQRFNLPVAANRYTAAA
ncbi:LLM class flavin-dependent oxidoreductase [Bosea caraganae]|uniref:LLM class flavin-dependent oxidoreductase n=1 Tax=Bosea caraganae TaxID=2763117 RepID=A0A370L3P4_9HYPH|nr:LLM class flavin-dependent oxidoreductase [Bosea caraganae]RDJ22416.1 LLM class flavin-dependent oxidoreductase [Bosea caraganae]RDJ30375.1 LLM class flavin-dependent oxidoreductase [Bosea caraganae]